MSTPSRFTPSLLPGEDLERLFVARQDTLARVMCRVRGAAGTSRRSHTLIVGPRGSGKTHLAALVAHRTRRLIHEGARLQLAWLTEDPWRIASYTHLLRAIMTSLDHRTTRGVAEDPGQLEREVAARAVSGGPIVTIVENLDLVLHQIGTMGQQRLRHLLQAERSLLLVATTTTLDADLASQSAPFYGFFTTETLRPFTVDQAQQMLGRIAEFGENRQLADYLQTPEAAARLRAVAHLAGGQPRLWALLASGLTVQGLDQLVDVLMSRFDDLTPYYQEKLGRLSSQQRLVVAELADTDQPLYVADLAGRLGVGQRSIAKTINDLVGLGWVTESTSPVVHLTDRRRTYYELAEPLVRLAFQLKESHGRPVRIVADFLRAWFDPAVLRDAAGSAGAYVAAALDTTTADPALTLTRVLAGTRLPDDQVETTRLAGRVDEALADLVHGEPDAYLALPIPVRGALDERLDVDRLPDTAGEARLDLHATVSDGFGAAPHPEADAWVRRAEDLARACPPDLRLRAAVQLTDWYGKAWRLEEASATWDAIQDQLDPGTNLMVATRLADAYQAAGQARDAVEFLELATADAERRLGHDDPYTLGALNNLADLYLTVGRSDEAVRLFERVLVDAQRLLGVDDPRTLAARNNLADAYRAAGRSDEAVRLFERALSDAQRLLGDDDPRTMASRNNLAFAYYETGRLEESVTLFRQASGERTRALGPDHPDTLATRSGLALALGAAGRSEESIGLLTEVLKEASRILGAKHPQTLTTGNNLALEYYRVGRFDQAAELFEQTLADLVTVLGPDHPDTKATRANLAQARKAAGPPR